MSVTAPPRPPRRRDSAAPQRLVPQRTGSRGVAWYAPACVPLNAPTMPLEMSRNQRNDDWYSLYGTWPLGLALSACTTLAGIGVQRAGM